MIWQTNSSSSEQTEALGVRLGRLLKGGETIELVSDLGGGKTTFTQGIMQGMGSPDRVASPTFTISRLYQAGPIDVHHFDFYRLSEPGIVADELAEVIQDPQAVVIVEWGDNVQHVLPDDRLTITFRQTPTGERELTFRAPETWTLVFEELQNE